MFEASTLDGIPYLSYIPKPIMPAVTNLDIKRFRELDASLSSGIILENALDKYIDVVLQNTVRRDSAENYERTRKAIEYAFTVKRVSRKHFIKFNQLLVGHNENFYRKRPVWLGATHPAHSWFVGSPASKVENLVDQVFKISSQPIPISLAVLVSLFRLLSIHPFMDGNGRTARLYAIHLMHCAFGPRLSCVNLLGGIWDRPKFDSHSASTAIRDHEDWSILFDYYFSIVERQSNLP